MCIIVVKPRNKTIKEETFKNCFDNNPDGCGFMYVKKGMVYGKKGIMSYKEFLREQKRIPKDVNVVYHFRISTHGGVVPQLTHPFPLASSFEKMHKLEWWNEYGVVHNGIFTRVKAPEGESDTEVFISNVLKPLQELSKIKQNSLIDKYYDDIIESAVGTSKLAIMDKTGFVRMYGNGWINGEDGCYYSNSTYSYSVCNYGKYGGWDYIGNTHSKSAEKLVKVMIIGKDDVDSLNPPEYLFEGGVTFMDKDGYVYFYSQYDDCFRKSVYHSNTVFNEDESFNILAKAYDWED